MAPGAGPRSESLLRVDDLRVSYKGAVRALHGVSIEVAGGAVVTVLGNNGAGKSTLLRAISGTLPLHGGKVDVGSITFGAQRLDGSDPAAIVRRGVVQVPEGRRIFAHLSVDENLRAAALATGDKAARATARSRVYDLFPVLAARRFQPGGLLSGGEQQMLAIGRALMTSPRLLLLDEPSLGLAPRIVGEIAEVIRGVNERGTAVLLVEQHAATALRLADFAYVLEVGRVSLAGRADKLAGSDDVRHRYLGISAGQPARTEADAGDGSRREAGSPGSASPPRLEVEGVSVGFGGVQALADVSFAVEPGTVHALIGPNGAGKSTCLNVLTGVYPVARGRVRFGAAELTRMRPHEIVELGIGRTFQNIALSPTATVADNLMLGRHRLTSTGFTAAGLRLPSARREHRRQRARVAAIADLVGLGGRLDTQAGALSYGEQKRVELARALCTEPSLLLLDEPVSGMNDAESQQMAEIIATARAALGISIVVVEHNMGFVMGLANRVTVLDFGRCIADASPEDVQRHPDVMRAYLGPGVAAAGAVAAGEAAR